MKKKIPLTKSDRTRNFIIERSAAVFNKKGIAGTSISDIMDVTGLTKGSIYGNFKDKEEVALAVFEYNVRFTVGDLFARMHSLEGTIQKLLKYPHYFREVYQKVFDNGGCAILNTAIEADDTYAVFKEVVIKTIKSWESDIIKIIEEGKQKKEISLKIDSDKYASLFIGMFEGGVMLSKVTGDTKYLFNSLDHIESIILNEFKA